MKITNDTTLGDLAMHLEEFGYDLLLQSPPTSDLPWVATIWAQEEPTQRACSCGDDCAVALDDALATLTAAPPGGNIKLEVDQTAPQTRRGTRG